MRVIIPLTEDELEQQADNLLSDLTSQGKIRRVARGMYDYPRYSELLQKTLAPNIDEGARPRAGRWARTTCSCRRPILSFQRVTAKA